VSPILGIYASQISGHLFAPSGAYDSIATATGTGSTTYLSLVLFLALTHICKLEIAGQPAIQMVMEQV
jgi:hypothetical protein